jgi:hypothetical protein
LTAALITSPCCKPPSCKFLRRGKLSTLRFRQWKSSGVLQSAGNVIYDGGTSLNHVGLQYRVVPQSQQGPRAAARWLRDPDVCPVEVWVDKALVHNL